MPLTIAFSEPSTVGTSGQLLAAGSVYDSGHGNWVYLGFRSPLNVASVQTSPDRVTWTMHNMPSASTWRAIAYSPTLNLLAAVGNGVAAYSTDGGVTWNAAVSLPEANNWIDVQWWAAKSIFVMVAGGGTHRVGTSSDGKSWTMQSAASALVWSGLAVSSTTAVAVAFASVASTQLVMTSTDGATWTLQTHASLKSNRGVVSSAARLSVGYSSSLNQFLWSGTDAGNITSAWGSTDNGVTWAASSAIPTISNTTNRGFVWLNAANSWYLSCADQHYGESTDGVNWSVTDTSLIWTNSGYTPMAWLDSTGVLLGGSTLGFDDVLVGLVTIPHVITVTRVTPNAGTFEGGTNVTITGSGFSFLPLVTSVTFGGSAATNVVVVNDTTITCTTPVHATGPVDVVVGGAATLTAGYTYTFGAVLLPPIPYTTPIVQAQSGTISTPWATWFRALLQAINGQPETVIPAQNVVGVFNVSQIPVLPWSRINKAGSSLADLALVSAAAINAGILPAIHGGTGSAIPVVCGAFDPGSFTVPANEFMLFSDYVSLGANEALTVNAGAIVRVI